MAASIPRRLFGVSSTVAGITLMAAAVAALSTWLPFAGREGLDHGPDAATTALFRLGLSAVFVGGAILAFLYFFRHWPTAQAIPDDNVDGSEMSPALILFGVYLAALPFLFVAAAAPALRFARAHRTLGDDPIGGFVLTVPLFETLMTVGLFIGAVAVVGLFLSKSAAFPKSFIALVGFQLGFVLMAFAAIDLGLAVTDPLASVVPLLQEHHAAVRTVARNQTGLFVASAVWVVFLIVSPRATAAFASQSETWVSPGSPSATIHRPSSLVVEQPGPAALRALMAENAPRYAVRANYVAGFLGGALEAVDLNSPAVLSATLGPMTGHIHLYSSGRVLGEIVKATRNRYFTSWPAYEVAASADEPLGGMKKVSRTEWRIFDPSGREIGSIDQGAVSTGRAKYRAHIGNTPVCTFAWSNVLMPELVLDCSPNAERLLDGRLALACALALFVDVCPSA
jgi:hypothetical protein